MSSTTDYEELQYDAKGQVITKRLRDGLSLVYGYDFIGRLALKTLPGSEAAVSYGHDNLGQTTSVTQAGYTLSFRIQCAGPAAHSDRAPRRGSPSEYDAAGRRYRLTWPDNFYVDYDYHVTGEMTAIREYGVTSGVGVFGKLHLRQSRAPHGPDAWEWHGHFVRLR